MNYQEKGHDYQWEVIEAEVGGYRLRVYCTYESLMPVGIENARDGIYEWCECIKEREFAKGEIMKELDNRREWIYDDSDGPMMIGIREWVAKYMDERNAKLLLNGKVKDKS